MIDILICDDNVVMCGELEKIVESWSERNGAEVSISLCFSGKSLRDYIRTEGCPDLLFLDIELGDDTGIQIGDYIREQLRDDSMQIVFVSSHIQYAMELFRIRPFDFLVKPVKYGDAERVLQKYQEIRQKEEGENRYFVYQHRKQAHRLAAMDILYFQSSGRKIWIFTKDSPQPAEYYGTLGEAMEHLDCSKFWNIHKSFIVNIEHVEKFAQKEFTLKCGVGIPVSRSRWKDVQQWIMQCS